MQFEEAYSELNPRQKEAVDRIEGPVLVVAGPGTGKTQVLALRIANILKKTDTPPYAILAMTFTESGARSMRERLVEMIGPDGYYVRIGTFHGFASMVMRENPDVFMLHEDAEPLSDLERVQLFTEILEEHDFQKIKPLKRPFLFMSSLIHTIQDLKREGQTPESFRVIAEDLEDEKQREKLLEVAEVFRVYEQKMDERKRFDYEDMIIQTLKQFRGNDELLRKYQEQYLYFLVDEYQDTNTAQNELLFQLASFWGDQANVFAVGDPDQAIYRFQGASLENVLTFKELFPLAKVIQLDYNYRSQQTVLDVADRLIQKNVMKSSDILEGKDSTKLTSQTSYALANIKLAKFPSEVVEYAYLGKEIQRLMNEGVAAEEIAIIYRENRDADEIADVLGRMGIKYNLEGGDNVLEAGIIVRLLTIFEAIVGLRNGSEDIPLFTLFNFEFYDGDRLDVMKLARFASRKKVNLLEALEHKEVETIGLKNLEKMQSVQEQLLYWGAQDQEVTLVQLFETILQESGLLNWVMQQPDQVRQLNQLNSFFRYVKQLNMGNHTLGLEDLLQTVALLREYRVKVNEDDLDINVGAVRLSTAHKIKGQEFGHVFIVKAIDGKWGNKRVPQMIKLPEEALLKHVDVDKKKEQNEDERRLFYVALTRAKEQCTITYSQNYYDKATMPSMFVSELPGDLIDEIDTSEFQKEVPEILRTVFAPVKPEMRSPEEKVFLKSIVDELVLSPTALNTYLACPYRFKLEQLLKTPRAKIPVLSYGTAMHTAMEVFFKRYQEEGRLPANELLVSVFEKAIEEELMTEATKETWKASGVQALEKYYANWQASMEPPIMTERWFGGKFNNVVLDDIPLLGKVDKIELIDENLKTVRVVDYKSGRPKSRNEILGKTKYADPGYWRQLVFYKLVADLDPSFGYSVREVQLDFVEENQSGKLKKETFEVGTEEVESLKALIRETMVKIRNLEFEHAANCNCDGREFSAHCFPDGKPRVIELEGEQLRLA